MGKLSNTRRKSNKKPATLQDTFNDALERYQRFKEQNVRFAGEMDSMMARVTPKIKPQESQLLNVQSLLTAKIIPFMSKKSLPEYVREELKFWIFDNFDELQSNPFFDSKSLQPLVENYDYHCSLHIDNANQKMFEKLAKKGVGEDEINQIKSLAEKVSGATTQEEKEALLKEAFSHVDPEDDDLNDGLGSLFDEDPENLFDDFDPFAGDDFSDDGEEEELKRLNKLFSQSAINKLFRRMSRALHPDLEQDPDKKQEKHHKMVALIEARDQKDIAYLLQTYKELFGQLPESFPDEDYEKLIPLVLHMIDKVKAEKFKVFDDIPMSSVFYEIFYDKNIKKENANIQRHVKFLKDREKALQSIAQDITSIAKLRNWIEIRQDDRAAATIADFDDL